MHVGKLTGLSKRSFGISDGLKSSNVTSGISGGETETPAEDAAAVPIHRKCAPSAAIKKRVGVKWEHVLVSYPGGEALSVSVSVRKAEGLPAARPCAAPLTAGQLTENRERRRGKEEKNGTKIDMAAEIHSRPQSSRPVLLNKIEGHQDAVNAALLIPKEDGVITVSEDR